MDKSPIIKELFSPCECHVYFDFNIGIFTNI